MAGLDEQSAEHEQQVGEIDVGAHAVGEDGAAGEEDEGGERAGGPPEPLGAELVDGPAAGGEREEAERDGDLAMAWGASGESTSPSSSTSGWGVGAMATP